MKAVIYLRISKDRTGEAEGIERQEEDCRELIRTLGWTLVRVYTDNDKSATTGKRRPDFERLIRDMESGSFGAIVAWNGDRVYRTPLDRLRFIEACRTREVSLQLVRGTGIDMTSWNGRMVAGMLGEAAWAEVGNKSDRQRRANRQAAEKGKPWLTGPRPFGYQREDGTLVPDKDEAPILKDAFRFWTAGASLNSVNRLLNESGQKTTLGNEWRANNTRVTLSNPVYAGFRAYQEMPPLGSAVPVRTRRAEPADRLLVKGKWEPLVSEDTWRASVARMRDPSRKKNVENFSSVKWLGTNLFRCLRCGEREHEGLCYVNWRSPSRRDGSRGLRIYKCKSCHMSRRADPIDAFVEDVMVERLNAPDFAEFRVVSGSTMDVAPLRVEAQELRTRLDTLADAFADGDMSRDQFARANTRTHDRLVVVEGKLAEAGRGDLLASVSGPAAGDRWLDSEDIRWRRSVMAAICAVTLAQPSIGRPSRSQAFDPDSVLIDWLR